MIRVECDGCSAPYTVSERRIPAGGLKMRCPKCGASFLVERPDAGGGERTTPPSASAERARRAASATALGPGPPEAQAFRGGGGVEPEATPKTPPAVRHGGAALVPKSKRSVFSRRRPEEQAPSSDADFDLDDLFGHDGGRGDDRGIVKLAAPRGQARDTGIDVDDLFGAEGEDDRFGVIDADLPSLARGDNLPAVSHDDLPDVAVRTDLPDLKGGDILPAVAKGNLPAVAKSELPAVKQGDLPTPKHDDLPVLAAHDDLPTRAGAGLQSRAARDLPDLSLDEGLPALHDGNLPELTFDGDLPSAPADDLPSPPAAALPSRRAHGPSGDDLPALAQHPDLPTPKGRGLDAPSAGLPAAPRRGSGAAIADDLDAHDVGDLDGFDLPAAAEPNLPTRPNGATADLPMRTADLPTRPLGADLPTRPSSAPPPALHGDLPTRVAVDDLLPEARRARADDLPALTNRARRSAPPDSFGEALGLEPGDLGELGDDDLGAFGEMLDSDLGADLDDLDLGDLGDLGDLPPPPSDLASPAPLPPAPPPSPLPPDDDLTDLDDLGLPPADDLDDLAPPPASAVAPRSAVGDEFQLDEADGQPLSRSATEGRAPATPPVVALPPRRRRGLRIALVALPLLALAGGSLALTSLGAFGIHAIRDSMNAEQYQAVLQETRAASQELLGKDTAAAATQAMAQAKARQKNETPRFAPMASYAAYVTYAKVLRFAGEPTETADAEVLMTLAEEHEPTPERRLAEAGQAAVQGRLPQALALAEALARELPKDVDVACLAGEVALALGKDAVALEHFERAAGVDASARARFGVARAHHALGNEEEALKSAAQTQEASKDHAGARTLAASVLWRRQKGQEPAQKALEEVIAEGSVRKNASKAELVTAYSVLGQIHLANTRMSAAEEAFQKALEVDNKALPALVGVGELLYRAGRHSEALTRFKAALVVNAKSEEALIGVAKTELSLERPKEAKALMQKALAGKPKTPLVAFWLGSAEMALGDNKAAEAAFRKAIETAPKDPDGVVAYVALANLLASGGQRAEADAVLAQASESLPESPALHRAKGEAALEAGRLDEAQKELRAALDLDEANVSTRFLLAVAHRRDRKFDVAARLYEEVKEQDADHPGLALELGLMFEEQGETEKALTMYSDALKKAPKDIDLKLRVGSTQVISGHAKQAIGLLTDVLRSRPGSAEANHFLGRAKLVLGLDLNDALRLLKVAAGLAPNRADYHLYVGWAANLTNRPADAEQALERTLALDKNLGDAYWQRAVLKQRRGRCREALDDLDLALELRPSRHEAHATRAICYQQLSQLGDAEASWRRAIEGNPNEAEWRYRYGKLMSQRRDPAATEQHKKAIELFEASKQKSTPYWLADAHFLLGEALESSDPAEALAHYEVFRRLAAMDNAYRADADRAVEALKRRLR